MLLSKFSMFLLFILAYIPLIVFMCIRFFSTEDWSLLLLLLITIGILFTIYFVNRLVNIIETDLKPSVMNLEVVELKNSEYLTFIVTYLVPFMGITMDIQVILALIGFFIFLGLIYLRTSLFCINPLLNLIWNYNIYEITIRRKKAFLLTKCHVSYGNQELQIMKLNEEVYLGIKP